MKDSNRLHKVFIEQAIFLDMVLYINTNGPLSKRVKHVGPHDRTTAAEESLFFLLRLLKLKAKFYEPQ